MVLRRYSLTLALVAWTTFVWATRILNIWRADDLSVGGQLFRTSYSVAFLGFAVVCGGAMWLGRRTGPLPCLTTALRAFSIFTLVFWGVRAVSIAIADHEAAFIIVHLVLAAVSIGLVLGADRQARLALAGSDEVPDPEVVGAR